MTDFMLFIWAERQKGTSYWNIWSALKDRGWAGTFHALITLTTELKHMMVRVYGEEFVSLGA